MHVDMQTNTIHIDKNSLKHLGICAALGALFGRTGFGAALGIGFYKEYIDKTEAWYHHWCWWDITFDVLGALVGLAINTTAQLLIFKHLVY